MTKLITITIFLFGLSVNAKAQNSAEENQDTVLTIVEQMPEYPGGMNALTLYLQKNIKYPKKDRNKGIEGTVYVEFVIDKDGSILLTRVSKMDRNDATQAMKVEAVRVISEMPKWKPGMQRGKNVKVRYTIPIKFSL